MLSTDIYSEIECLQRELERYRNSRTNAINQRDEMERVIVKVRQNREKIEAGLQETLTTIQKRLNKLKQKGKFESNYIAKVKEVLYNANSSNAISETRAIETRATNKYWDLDASINWYNSKIRSLESQISLLRQQLQSMEGEN